MAQNFSEGEPRSLVEEPPPFLDTWQHVYVAVVVYLAFLIVLFYIFSRVFSA